jgi:hypothetical protein
MPDREAPECPRCVELRGRAVKMHTVRCIAVALAYECPSCDYTIPLAPFTDNANPGSA